MKTEEAVPATLMPENSLPVPLRLCSMATSAEPILEFNVPCPESLEAWVECLNFHLQYHEVEDAAKKKALLLASCVIAMLELARGLITPDDLMMVTTEY